MISSDPTCGVVRFTFSRFPEWSVLSFDPKRLSHGDGAHPLGMLLPKVATLCFQHAQYVCPFFNFLMIVPSVGDDIGRHVKLCSHQSEDLHTGFPRWPVFSVRGSA